MFLITVHLVLRKLPFHEQGGERGALSPGRIHRERLVMGRGWQGGGVTHASCGSQLRQIEGRSEPLVSLFLQAALQDLS